MNPASKPSQLSLFSNYQTERPQYISVSRRTDIPRFYHHHFLTAWQRGAITYKDGYGRTHSISLQPADVLGYIFWSKDYGPLLSDPRFKQLLAQSNAIFHFTINHCPQLEPGVAPLDRRLATLERLVDLVGPQRVIWRFDPICRYQKDGPITDTVAPFYSLLPSMAKLGLKRCYFSFMTHYGKLKKRRNIQFHHFTGEEKQAIATSMEAAAGEVDISLQVCCDPGLVDQCPGLQPAACIEEQLLADTDRFRRHLPLPRKPTRKGCNCHAARDIGSYTQRCHHDCLYCYANPG